MRYLILAILLVLFVPSLARASSICPDAKNTPEIEECIAGLEREAHSIMVKYLNAAIERYGDDDETVSRIKSAQTAWETYQSTHCGSVYSIWREGSIRLTMSLTCALYTTRMRTHDIWREFLTYMDSSPPALPEPEVMLRQ